MGSSRGGSRAAATSKMELFAIIVNGWKPLTIIAKSSILDVAAILDPPLSRCNRGCIFVINYNINNKNNHNNKNEMIIVMEQ